MNLINHKTLNEDTSIEYININKENFYKISNSDAMRSFFMSIVSDSNQIIY